MLRTILTALGAVMFVIGLFVTWTFGPVGLAGVIFGSTIVLVSQLPDDHTPL